MLRILVITCPLRPSLRRQFEATVFFPPQNNCMTYFRNDISHHLSKKKYSVWHTSICHWEPWFSKWGSSSFYQFFFCNFNRFLKVLIGISFFGSLIPFASLPRLTYRCCWCIRTSEPSVRFIQRHASCHRIGQGDPVTRWDRFGMQGTQRWIPLVLKWWAEILVINAKYFNRIWCSYNNHIYGY